MNAGVVIFHIKCAINVNLFRVYRCPCSHQNVSFTFLWHVFSSSLAKHSIDHSSLSCLWPCCISWNQEKRISVAKCTISHSQCCSTRWHIALHWTLLTSSDSIFSISGNCYMSPMDNNLKRAPEQGVGDWMSGIPSITQRKKKERGSVE